MSRQEETETQREMKYQCHPEDKCLDKKRRKLRDRLSVELFFEDHLEKQAKE